jgi:cardiolipin synthase
LTYLPNALSLSRVGWALALAMSIRHDLWTLALVLYLAAVITDMVDGPVARHLDIDSAWGGLLDHGSDAFFVIVVLTALCLHLEVTLILPILIGLAFLQYVFDSGAHLGEHLIASQLGRYNGIAYFALIGLMLGAEGLPSLEPIKGPMIVVYWLLSLSTLLSIFDRWLGRTKLRKLNSQ